MPTVFTIESGYVVGNFAIRKGITFDPVIPYTDANGVAISLAGWSARWTIKNTYNGSTLVALTDSSGITLGGAAGTVQPVIEAATSKAWDARYPYEYDSELIDTAGKVWPFLRGKITLEEDVTDT